MVILFNLVFLVCFQRTLFFFFPSPCLWSDPQYEFPFLDGFAAHNDKPVPVGGNKQVILCFVDGREDLIFIQQLIKH